jgi:hypothetical protein
MPPRAADNELNMARMRDPLAKPNQPGTELRARNKSVGHSFSLSLRLKQSRALYLLEYR